VSWSAGTLYKVFPGAAPFAGVSKSYLTNFNSEVSQNGLQAPESGLEFEAGVTHGLPESQLAILNGARPLPAAHAGEQLRRRVRVGGQAVFHLHGLDRLPCFQA
jgi:hypothetical protein